MPELERPDDEKGERTMRHVLSVLTLLILLVSCASAHSQGAKETTLYVWAGDAARQKPDFLAVVNFDEASPDYGKVLRTVPLPGPGNVGNEPHHCHLSEDGNVLACGGLLSVLRGQDDIFFFDVSQAGDPKLIKATRAPHASIIDDFYPLPGGGFLVTGMGSETGGAPGRILEFDPSLNLVKEWPENPPADGFNPHGISVRPELNLMVTSDFLNPISTIGADSVPALRGTIRVWDLARREIVRTIAIPSPTGTMDVRLIPGDPRGRAITNGMFDGWMYLVDPALQTAKPVFDYSTIVPGTPFPGAMPQIMEMTRDGRRLLVPQYMTGKILMFDTSNPEAPVLISSVDLGPKAGPHDIHLTEDEQRLVITDYFLEEDNFGAIHLDGDHQVHVVKLGPDKLTLDTRFQLDFNTAFSTGPARPHGIETK
jgi:DNA-binding beta-propeller fold protein YncE